MLHCCVLQEDGDQVAAAHSTIDHQEAVQHGLRYPKSFQADREIFCFLIPVLTTVYLVTKILEEAYCH